MTYKKKSWLYKKYHVEDKKQEEIADIADVSISTISYWMDKYGIETKQYERIQKEPDNIEEIKEEYNSGASLVEVADGLDVSHPTVRRWLKEAGVETREQYPEGEDNPRWEGGWEPDDEKKKFYASQAWKEKRREVLERDDNKCTQCGSTDDKLAVHHWRPISDGGAKLDMANLATVCQSCHNYLHEKIHFQEHDQTV